MPTDQGRRDVIALKIYTHLGHGEPQDRALRRRGDAGHAKTGIWESLQPQNIMMGESIGQTMGFVESGNAQLGFVALSQVLAPNLREREVTGMSRTICTNRSNKT